jgi:chromate reductase
MAKFLLMGMSLRKDSFNKKLVGNAYRILSAEKSEHQFELVQFNDFPMPVYDGDLETEKGLPEGVVKLGQKITEAKALILSTPEYNGGIPGPFKNAIDWVSRIKPQVWAGKKLLLVGASPGAFGAVSGIGDSRPPLTKLGVFVYPEIFTLPQAHLAFEENGKLKDASAEDRFRQLIVKFRDYV